MAVSGSGHFESEIVTLIVGPEEDRRTFRVHKSLLVSKSRYFRSCLDNFSESNNNSIMLEDQDGEAVEHFIEWLYTGKTNAAIYVPAIFVNGYRFADRIMSDEYHNSFIDTIRTLFAQKRVRISVKILTSLYKHGLSSTPMAIFGCELLGKEMATGSKDWIGNGKFAYEVAELKEEPDAMSNVMVQVFRYQSSPYDDPRKRQGCQFHRHENGKSCATADSSDKKDNAQGGKKV